MSENQLLFTTGMSLQGLMEGLDRADAESRERVSRINSELSRVSFQFNTSEAVSALERLSTAGVAALAVVRELRAALSAPITLNITTSGVSGGTGTGGGFRRTPEQILDTQILNDEERQNRQRERMWQQHDAEMSRMQQERIRDSVAAMSEHERLQRTWGGQFGGGSMQMLPEGRRLGAFSEERSFNPFSQYARQFGGIPSFGGSSMSEAEFRASLMPPPPPSSPTMFMGREVPGMREGFAEAGSRFGSFASQMGDNLLQAAAFAAVYGTVQGIKETFNETVAKGMEFNQQLESDNIALGAILSMGKQYETSTGQTASKLATYKASLSEAASVQEKLYDLDAKTLGTGRELVKIYEMITAFTRGNTEAESERLKFASGFLNASKILGQTEEQATKEAQQITSLERDQGQLILHALNISIQQARQWKESGIFFQEMNKHLEVFNQMGEEAGNSWTGLLSTFQSLSGRIAGATFSDTFSVTKEILAGINEEFRKMRENGEVVPAIFGGDKEGLKTFAADLAHGLKNVYFWSAEIANSFLKWGENLGQVPRDIIQFFMWAKSHMDTRGETAGLPSTPDTGLGGLFLSSSANAQLKELQNRLAVENTDMKTGGNLDTRIQQQQAIVNALASVNTATLTGGEGGTFDKYLEALNTAKSKVKELEAASNAAHVSGAGIFPFTAGVIDDATWKSQTATLKELNAEIEKSLKEREKTPPPDPKEEKQAVINRRNAAIAAAERAEHAVEKTDTKFTGNIDEYLASEKARIEGDRDRALAKTTDPQTRAALERTAAADIIKSQQDATKLFIDFKSREQAATDRTANAAIRSTELETKGQTQLLDIQISGIQRQIQFAELRKEPAQRILDLYHQEVLLIQQKSDLEIKALKSELPEVDKKIKAKEEEIKLLQQQLDLVNAPDKNDPRKAGDKARLEDSKAKVESDLTNDRAQRLDITNKIAAADERSQNATYQAEQKAQQVNKGWQQALRERLQSEELRQGEALADPIVDGIHSISRAIAEGKTDIRSYGDIFKRVIQDIEAELIESQIRKLILGTPTGGTGTGQASFLQGSTPGGTNGGLLNWLFGGGSSVAPSQASTAPPTRGASGGLGGFFGGIGGLFGGGASTAGFDANAINWGVAGSGTIPAGTGTGAGVFGGLFGKGGGGFGMGQAMGAFGMGTSIAGLTKDPGNIGNWLSLLMSAGMFFLHDGGIVGGLPSHHTGTLASDEHLAKVQTGEMWLSRNDTAALFSGASVRAPGGYRPDSRIFMANVSQANNRGGNMSGGGGGVHVHHWHISTPDPHAFGAAQSEIQRQGATAMQRANRRNN